MTCIVIAILGMIASLFLLITIRKTMERLVTIEVIGGSHEGT